MIGAFIDVELRTHPKALAAGEALYLWLYAMLECKAKMEDGCLPRSVLIACPWASAQANRGALTRLARAGLLLGSEREGVEWVELHNYLNKNESRDRTKARLAANAERSREYRENRKRARDGTVTRDVTRDVRVTAVSRRDETSRDVLSQGSAEGGRAPLALVPGTGGDRAVLAPRGDFGMGMRSWEAGVRRGLGRGFAPTCRGTKADEWISRAVEAHGPADPSTRLAWLDREGESFARKADIARFKVEIFGFVQWLNEGRPDRSSPRSSAKDEAPNQWASTTGAGWVPTLEDLGVSLEDEVSQIAPRPPAKTSPPDPTTKGEPSHG